MSQINGVVVGIVKSLDDPKKLGRVRLEFPWLSDKNQSQWARIATLMTGSGRGSWFMPEVEDEVLVAFDHGDIQHPYIVGFLWNGVDKPPNEEINTSVRRLRTVSGHILEFDDREGQEKILIETQGGQKDGAGKDKFTNSPVTYIYQVRCFFRGMDGDGNEHIGESPFSPNYKILDVRELDRAGLKIEPFPPKKAEQVPLFLKDRGLIQEQGKVVIRESSGGSAAVVELAASGAKVILEGNGDIRLEPASKNQVHIQGKMSVQEALEVDEDVFIKGNLNVAKDLIVKGKLEVTKDVVIHNDLWVNGQIYRGIP